MEVISCYNIAIALFHVYGTGTHTRSPCPFWYGHPNHNPNMPKPDPIILNIAVKQQKLTSIWYSTQHINIAIVL